MTQIEQVQINKLNEKMDKVLEVVVRLDESNKTLIDCKDDHEERLRTIELKPSKRMDVIITGLVCTVASAIVTYLMTGGI